MIFKRTPGTLLTGGSDGRFSWSCPPGAFLVSRQLQGKLSMKRRDFFGLSGTLAAGLFAAPAFGQVKKTKYPRGRKNPTQAVLIDRHKKAFARNDHITARIQLRAAPLPASYSCPIAIPPQDQGQCGSCWDFSGCEVATNAIIIASKGAIPADGSFFLSPQYVLDCGQNGGRDGDDNVTVLQQAAAQGLLTTAAYGPYVGEARQCRVPANPVYYKITNWGYCTPSQSQGVAAIADIKNYLMTTGPLGTGVAAGDDWDNYTTGVLTNKDRGVNHDVEIVAWDDTKGTAGCWLMRNSWGLSWGINGDAWVEYGADEIGTEAVWAIAGAQPLPTPAPGPSPDPGPTPVPIPPAPIPCTPKFHIFGRPHFRC
jgi:hypothetical protein